MEVPWKEIISNCVDEAWMTCRAVPLDAVAIKLESYVKASVADADRTKFQAKRKQAHYNRKDQPF